jgi:hypothetical protein
MVWRGKQRNHRRPYRCFEVSARAYNAWGIFGGTDTNQVGDALENAQFPVRFRLRPGNRLRILLLDSEIQWNPSGRNSVWHEFPFEIPLALARTTN